MKNPWLYKRFWPKVLGDYLRKMCLKWHPYMSDWTFAAWVESCEAKIALQGLPAPTNQARSWILGWAALAASVCEARVLAHDTGFDQDFTEEVLLLLEPEIIIAFRPTYPIGFSDGYRAAVKELYKEVE